jgi:hypothetical protein
MIKAVVQAGAMTATPCGTRCIPAPRPGFLIPPYLLLMITERIFLKSTGHVPILLRRESASKR